MRAGGSETTGNRDRDREKGWKIPSNQSFVAKGDWYEYFVVERPTVIVAGPGTYCHRLCQIQFRQKGIGGVRRPFAGQGQPVHPAREMNLLHGPSGRDRS